MSLAATHLSKKRGALFGVGLDAFVMLRHIAFLIPRNKVK